MRLLKKIHIKNFKSIRDQEISLGNLNIFIGGNGAGKSNLIQVFHLLKAFESPDQFSNYVAKRGGADRLLYFGRKRSAEITIGLEYEELTRSSFYDLRLIPTDDDRLAWRSLNPVGALRHFLEDIEKYEIYHFHDTSDSASMKLTAAVDDNRFLRPHAENLAAFLYWMKVKEPVSFERIQDSIRSIAPFFKEFQLEPSRLNESAIRLEWNEVGSDDYFNAASLSDGTLRFICLATLLLQPDLPPLILLDEPELGLHPAAIHLLAEMLKAASEKTQLIVATQSVTLVNWFTPEQVWAVDRKDKQSVFTPLTDINTADWLDDYALGDLWEKNILGARP